MIHEPNKDELSNPPEAIDESLKRTIKAVQASLEYYRHGDRTCSCHSSVDEEEEIEVIETEGLVRIPNSSA